MRAAKLQSGGTRERAVKTAKRAVGKRCVGAEQLVYALSPPAFTVRTPEELTSCNQAVTCGYSTTLEL